MNVRVDTKRAIPQATNALTFVNIEHGGPARRNRHAVETDQERVGNDGKIDFRCQAQLNPGITGVRRQCRRHKFPSPQGSTFRIRLDARSIRGDKTIVLGIATTARSPQRQYRFTSAPWHRS